MQTFYKHLLKTRVIIVFACLLGQVTPVLASEKADLIMAEAAINTRDYVKALSLIYPLAEKGNPEAQYYIGFMYYKGWGVTQDLSKAFHWFMLAAEQHHAEAESYIGFFYKEGFGVAKNNSEALKWLSRAAEQNNGSAQYNLGQMYHNGIGVPQDTAEALKWYRRSLPKVGLTAVDAINSLIKKNEPKTVPAASEPSSTESLPPKSPTEIIRERRNHYKK